MTSRDRRNQGAGLVVLMAILGLCALAVWLWRQPITPQWREKPTPTPRALMTKPEPILPLAEDQWAAIWQHPLFSPTRTPDPVREAVTDDPLPAFIVTGIVINDTSRWIYLHAPGHSSMRLSPGDRLTSGWRLESLSATQATFEKSGERHRVSLPIKRLPLPSHQSPLTLPNLTTP